MNETGLAYVGEVTLSLKIKDKIIKKVSYNKGCSQLFRLLALVLTGNMTTESLDILKPTYIDVKYEDDGDWESCLYSKIPVIPSFYMEEDVTVEGNQNYISSFSSTISFSNINDSVVQASGFDEKEVRLFLLSGEEYTGSDDSITRLATLKVSPASLQSLQPGSQVIVEWSMKFKNA